MGPCTAPAIRTKKSEVHFRACGFNTSILRPVTLYCPVPESPTDCGLVEALSFTFNFPLRLPVAPGVKITLTVHVPPAGTEEAQVLVCEKSPLLVPVMLIPVMVSATFCRFVNVVFIGLLEVPTATVPKFNEVGLKVTGLTPVPVTEIVCGLLLAVSEMVTVPDCFPATVGVKVTVMLQVAPAAMDVPHVFC